MTMKNLIAYEAILWRWMEKTNAPNIVNQLNAIHREVEWRCQEKDWKANDKKSLI